jgi:hypothetical protein
MLFRILSFIVGCLVSFRFLFIMVVCLLLYSATIVGGFTQHAYAKHDTFDIIFGVSYIIFCICYSCYGFIKYRSFLWGQKNKL